MIYWVKQVTDYSDYRDVSMHLIVSGLCNDELEASDARTLYLPGCVVGRVFTVEGCSMDVAICIVRASS